jgi:Family of unknown function (DUF5689)
MKRIHILLSLCAIVLIGGLSACRKKAEVPADVSGYDPNLPVNSTIAQLKDAAGSAFIPYQIQDDITIKVIVTADDRSGNFYKQLMVADETSGIPLLIERSGLYVDYPIGRELYIKCKGLYIGVYHGMKQLGYSLDSSGLYATKPVPVAVSGIPSAVLNKIIIKSNYPNPLPVKHFSLAELNNKINDETVLGSLVIIDSNVQFTNNVIGNTYAMPSSMASATNRTVEQCGSTTLMDLRTSGFANFSNEKVATGLGSLTVIFSRYDNYKQLAIRDLSDIKFNDPIRCDQKPVVVGTPITIKDLRALYTGTNIKLGPLQIHGTIISSIKDSTANTSIYYLQDESGRGINIYYAVQFPAPYFQLGDSVTVELNGDSLINYKTNIMELKNGSNSNLIFTIKASGKTVVPTQVTIPELLTDLAKPNLQDRIYESRLLKIVGGTIVSSTGFYSGAGTTLNVGTDAVTMYLPNRNPFNITSILPGSNVSVVGIGANYYTTPQILPRRLSDIQ